jgi:hypothetical protein
LTRTRNPRTALTREQIDCITLDGQDEPKLIETLIHDLYDLSYESETEDDFIAFCADMYLVAKKYGVDHVADIYLKNVLNEVLEDITSSQFALLVTKFCGPSAAACYADIELPEKIFDSILREARLLLDENENFCKSLENGTLFNPTYSGRFAIKVVEMYRDAERASW